MMSFHKPDMFADCPFLTFGRAQAAANDLLLYGFAIPAALGVMLWIFARLSQAPLALPIVPVVAANLWHLGVLIGTVAILLGGSSGHPWLEYPRAAAVLLFAAFMLIAVSAAATMGFRTNREMYPSHWFLFAALLWFAWSYGTANLFLVSNHAPRGVVQAIIGWWLTNNLLFVWLALAGIGIAFYFLPKIAGKPLAGSGYALFAFLTLMFFGTWCGIPQGAPVPAWLPTVERVRGAAVDHSDHRHRHHREENRLGFRRRLPGRAVLLHPVRRVELCAFGNFVCQRVLPALQPRAGLHLVRLRRHAMAVARLCGDDSLRRDL